MHFSQASFIKHNPEVAAQLRVHTCMLCTNALMTAAAGMSLNSRAADMPANTAQSCREVPIPCTQPLGVHEETFMGDVHDCAL